MIKYISLTFTLVLFFFLLFPNRRSEVENFEAKNYVAWISVLNFKILNLSYFNNNKVIERPVLTWQHLLRLELLDKDAISIKNHCIFYKIPYKDKKGILKVVEIDEKLKCKEGLNKASFTELNQVENLKLFFYGSKTRLEDEEGKILRALTLYFAFDYKGKKIWASFPFVNIKSGMKRERYSSSAVKRRHLGLMIWPMRKGIVDFKNRKSHVDFLGTLDDDYPHGKSIICHMVDDRCNTVGQFSCHRCRYGWFEVAGSECPDTNIKLCGINRCGERNWPSCPRGRGPKRCSDGSRAGLCLPELRTFCDENNILICL